MATSGDRTVRALAACLLACPAIFLASCGGGSLGRVLDRSGSDHDGAAAQAAPGQAAEDSDAAERFRTVPKAHCTEEDHPETGLQGQVSAALRASGFNGFNCNLKARRQVRGDGANWQTAEFKDRVHKCAYHGTSYSTANRSHLGVSVVDVTNPGEAHGDRISDDFVDAGPLGVPEGQ